MTPGEIVDWSWAVLSGGVTLGVVLLVAGFGLLFLRDVIRDVFGGDK